jgi:hypothetical protein
MSSSHKPLISCFLEAWNLYCEEKNKEFDALSDFTEEYVQTMLNEFHCDEIIREFGFKALIELMCKLEAEDKVYEDLLDFSSHKQSWTEEALIRSALDQYHS